MSFTKASLPRREARRCGKCGVVWCGRIPLGGVRDERNKKTCCFVSFRFVSFRFVSFRFFSFLFVSFRLDAVCFVSFRFLSCPFVFGYVSFEFVSLRFAASVWLGANATICASIGRRELL